MRIVYPCRSNFIRRAARNKRKKPTLIELDCKILLVKKEREKQKIREAELEFWCPVLSNEKRNIRNLRLVAQFESDFF